MNVKQDVFLQAGASRGASECLGVEWLGQMGVALKSGNHSVYVDAFLSKHPRRRFPPVLMPEEIHNATLICGTHDHKDHIDREAWPVLAKTSPEALFVVPEFLLRKGLAEELDIPAARFRGLNDGTTTEHQGVRITAVASAHEFLDYDAGSGLYPYLGYIIEVDGFAIYHAGDTCRYEGLAVRLKSWRLDLMVLPINGRDAERYSQGYIGNMTYQEAVDLAGELQPRVVVPGHYDLFSHNSVDPQKFVDYMRVKYPQQEICVCMPGARYHLRRERIAPQMGLCAGLAHGA